MKTEREIRGRLLLWEQRRKDLSISPGDLSAAIAKINELKWILEEL